MPNNNSDLLSGTIAMPGIYVVTHRNTAHDAPHLVLILEQRVLPKCNHCRDVFFTLERPLIQLIDDCEFFGP